MFIKIWRIFLTVVVAFAISALLTYGYLVVQNNRNTEYPTASQYKESLERSLGWLEANQESVLKEDNPMLWWFLSESAKNTNNIKLQKMVNLYIDHVLHPGSVWNCLFNIHFDMPADWSGLLALPDENIHFIYGLTCNEEVGQLDIIKKQLDSDFCRWRPIISPCTTHQLMGMNFMRLGKCGDAAMTDKVISDLQAQIERQLILDPRVGDVYIQRVLMLVATGARERVKPIWLARVLAAQADDGGWQTFYPLFPVGGSRFFGFSYFTFDIREYKPCFHTVAQATYLMSLMASEGGK